MAGPFDDLIPSAGAAQASNPFADLIPKKSLAPGDVLRSVASGISLGSADELSAAFDATVPIVGQTLAKIGLVGGGQSEAPDWKARYEENLARERGIDKRIAEDHPYVDAAAKAGGAVAGTIAALPAAAVRVGPSAIANIARLTATGGGLGAAQGFAEGEGINDRLQRAAVGGVVGGSLGALGRPVAAVGRSIAESAPGRLVGDYIARPVANAVSSIFQNGTAQVASGAESGALNRMATALQRSKAGAPEISNRLNTLGEQAMLADTDPQFLSMARTANTMPGETRTLSKSVLEARDMGAPQRLTGAFEGNQPPPSTYALRGENQAFDQYKRGIGQEAYGNMRANDVAESPAMQQLKQVPAVKDAIAQIEADAANTGTQLSPIEMMHRVKQKLNDTADAAFASGRPINKNDVRDLASAWEGAFWQANPSAQAADTAYAKAASLPQYFDAGRSLLTRGTTEKAMDSSAPALADLLTGASGQQQIAARSGATNAVRETADNITRARTLARNINEGVPLQQKIGELYPTDQAQSIFRRAGAEKTFAETSNDILRGSKTADKAAEAMDFGNAGVRVTPGGITPRFTETINSAINWVRAPNEAVRDKIGQLALSPKTAENKRTLELLASILQSRASGARGAAGIAGAAGGAAGGL